MLRKHLQRLEQPVHGEKKLETDHHLKSEQEESEHEIEGL